METFFSFISNRHKREAIFLQNNNETRDKTLMQDIDFRENSFFGFIINRNKRRFFVQKMHEAGRKTPKMYETGRLTGHVMTLILIT